MREDRTSADFRHDLFLSPGALANFAYGEADTNSMKGMGIKMIKDILKMTEKIDAEIASLDGSRERASRERKAQLEKDRAALLDSYSNLTPEDRVFLSRHPQRPKIDDYINALFTDFFEQRGDRQCKEDASMLGGIALYRGHPVTVIGQRKGRNLEENLKYNFGMPGPEGYRKALRIMKQAEKFGRPIITFIDTPGAYPGLEAEERGQGEAIARNLAEMSLLKVPVIAVVTGEGASGGALAIGVANKILMLENAIYSVLSPEGFASILWKDSSRHAEACDIMKLTARDLYDFGIVEEIISEPRGGAQTDPEQLFLSLDASINKTLSELCHMSGDELARDRYNKFRKIGQ